MTKRKVPDKEWLVPMKFKGWGTAFVAAATAKEAEEKVANGENHHSEVDETSEWEVAGSAELNQ